jgi:hypothetical protein
MRVQIICVLLLIIIALSVLCVYINNEAHRNGELAEEWARKAGYCAGRINVLNQAKVELIIMLRAVYLRGVQDGRK